jgi:UDP-2-acetamido-3-amino-2,3-dideoxy-glucuronate N-acetyltransferase
VSQSIAVIGCGYWGKNLVRVFSQLGALKCVCDTDAGRFGALSVAGDPPKFTDKLAEVLDDSSLRSEEHTSELQSLS